MMTLIEQIGGKTNAAAAQPDSAAMSDRSTNAQTTQAHSTALLVNQPLRLWKNGAGDRQAQAILIQVSGDQASLCRADGRPCTISLDRLSPEDQAYVQRAIAGVGARRAEVAGAADSAEATQNPSVHVDQAIVPPAASKARWADGDAGELIQAFIETQFAGSAVMRAIGRSGVDRIATWWSESANESAPANVAYVRVSRRFLNRYVERAIDRSAPVSDYILGSSVSGASATRGKTELVFIPDSRRAAAEIRLRNDVSFNTVARHSPVDVYTRGVTHVTAGKPLWFDGRELRLGAAWADAQTESATVGIDSDLWLFRRASIRIASRRVAAQKDLADRIVAAHAAARTRDGLEREANRGLVALKRELAQRLSQTPVDPGLGDLRLECCSYQEALVFAMLWRPSHDASTRAVAYSPDIRAPRGEPQGATAVHFLPPPSWSGQNHDIEVFVHRGLVTRYVRESKFQEAVEAAVAVWKRPVGVPDDKRRAAPRRVVVATSLGEGARKNENDWLKDVKMSANGSWYRLTWDAASPTAPQAPPPRPLEPAARPWVAREN